MKISDEFWVTILTIFLLAFAATMCYFFGEHKDRMNNLNPLLNRELVNE